MPADREKCFSVLDRSGRGITVTLTLGEICERWDCGYTNNPNDEFELSLAEWLANADVGDSYFHDEQNVEFICVRSGGL